MQTSRAGIVFVVALLFFTGELRLLESAEETTAANSETQDQEFGQFRRIVAIHHLEQRILQLARSDAFNDEQAARRNLVALMGEEYGEDHCRTTEARLYLKSVTRTCQLSPEQQTQIADARKKVVLFQEALSAGHPEQALEVAQQALKVYHNVQGEPDAVHVELLIQMSNLQKQLGLDREAQTSLSRAVDIRLQLIEGDDAKNAALLLMLAESHLAFQEFQKAEKLLLKAIAIWKNAPDPGELYSDPPIRGLLPYNLALAQNGVKKYHPAESAATEASAVFTQHLPKHYPLYVRSQLELARSHMGQQQYSKASIVYGQVLAILDAITRQNNSHKPPALMVAEVLDEYATALIAIGDQKSAEQHKARASQLRTQVAEKPDSETN